MAETIEEVENDLAALMTQIDELTKKIVKIEVQFKRNDKYIPLYEWKKPRDNRGKRVEEMLSVILHKVSEHEGVFDEMKKNIEVMKQLIGSHSRSAHLLENFMNYELPHLCPIKQLGLPSDTRANPNNGE